MKLFRITLKYRTNYYQYDDDFGEGYPEASAIFMYEEGNYSCDCNRSVFIQQHCEPKFKEMGCGDKIELISIKALTKGA